MRERLFLFICFSVFGYWGWAQNLVPNSSFEDYTSCPGSPGQVYFAVPWYSAKGTVDYYQSCGIGDYNVPNAQGGGGAAYYGEAYVGLGSYVPHSPISREFAEVELISPLVSGSKYNVEFYVSLVDSCWYAINSIGACLTSNGIGGNLNQIFSLTPQIQNPDSIFLDEKDKWMKVSGSFYADGTEKYIAIGNFRDNQNTDTILVHQSSNWVQAHYYLDDVSVTLDTTTGINESHAIHIAVYPNPATDAIHIEAKLQTGETGMFELWAPTGERIRSVPIRSTKNSLDVSGIAAGLYYYVITIDGDREKTGKQIIIR